MIFIIMLSFLSVTVAMPNSGIDVNIYKGQGIGIGIGVDNSGVYGGTGGIYFEDNKTILCSSDADGSTGFCSTERNCIKGKGRAVGTCQGGICCKVESSCGSTSDFPVTYFQNPSYPSADTDDVSCNFNIEVSKGVCQLRVDFEEFEIPGPDVGGVCLNSNNFKIFAASTPNGILGGTRQSGLCGLNKGQHLYVSVQPNDVVQMHFTLSGIGAVPSASFISLNSDLQYLWNLKITQIECRTDDPDIAALKAPSGCLQYYRGNFGTIKSFGMDGNNAFAPDQNYFICIAQDAYDTRKFCGVDLRAVQFGLPVAEAGCQAGDAAVSTAECCTADAADASLGINSVVAIGGEGTDGTPRYRYCGLALGGPTNQIISTTDRYIIHVRSGVGRILRTVSGTNNQIFESVPPGIDVGFQLNYKVITGSC